MDWGRVNTSAQFKSVGTPEFWALYRRLPSDVRQRVREAYRLWRKNPAHPGLQFKKVSNSLYSVRIDINHRALGVMIGAMVTWVWIGKHTEYEKLLK